MYNEITFDFDVSILKLKTALVFNEKVMAACLPQPTFKAKENGGFGVVSGWGSTTEGGISSVTLQYVTLPLITRVNCTAPQTIYGSTQITENMVCAGFQDGGKDACQGDS